jgi:hypothetical protein
MEKSLLTRISNKIGVSHPGMISYSGVKGADIGLPELIGELLSKIPNDIPKLVHEVQNNEWLTDSYEKKEILMLLQQFSSILVPELLKIYQETFDAL